MNHISECKVTKFSNVTYLLCYFLALYDSFLHNLSFFYCLFKNYSYICDTLHYDIGQARVCQH